MTLAELEAHRRTVETPSGAVSYLDVGRGAPALFVHGIATNAYLWRDVMAGLDDVRRCIAVDLPLHGRSPAGPDQDLSASGFAEVLEEVCEALGLATVDLVANDTGGAVAQIFAARHPERLRSLTLTNCDTQDAFPPDAFAPTVELARQGQLADTAAQLLNDLEQARALTLGSGYEDPAHLTDEVLRAYLEPVMCTLERAKQFERCLASIDAKDLVEIAPQLKELTTPTLIVWGTGDEFFDLSEAYWLRDTIPGATEVVEVPGAKLFFPDERPGDLIPHLRRHWSATSG